MAQSNFKRHNLSVIQAFSDDLISHMTRLEPESTNFRIAQEYISSNFQNNNFLDTNENEIKRSIANL